MNLRGVGIDEEDGSREDLRNYRPKDETVNRLNEFAIRRMEGTQTFHLFVTGLRRTGDSVLLKAMKADIDDFFLSDDAGVIGAPTGGAAYHSLLGIYKNPREVFQRLNSETLGKLREKLVRLKVLIIDGITEKEVVNYRNLRTLSQNGHRRSEPVNPVTSQQLQHYNYQYAAAEENQSSSQDSYHISSTSESTTTSHKEVNYITSQ
ncbi:unnamed protein product [Caenorhabditis brenneri]